jgi:hypothetical protein
MVLAGFVCKTIETVLKNHTNPAKTIATVL